MEDSRRSLLELTHGVPQESPRKGSKQEEKEGSRRDEDEQWSGQPRPVLDRILTAQSTIALQLTLAKIVSRIPIWYRKASLDR